MIWICIALVLLEVLAYARRVRAGTEPRKLELEHALRAGRAYDLRRSTPSRNGLPRGG